MTERPNIIDILYDVSDAELIQAWRDAEPEFQRARQVLFACEGELVRRMGEKLSLETDEGTVVRSPQLGPYQWDRQALEELFRNRLDGRMWAEIFVPVTEVKTRTAAVQKYAKKLGVSEAELGKCYFRAERKQELEFYPPEDSLLSKLEQSVIAERAKREGVQA